MTGSDLITRYAREWAPPRLVAFNKRHGTPFNTFCTLQEPAMELLPPLPEGYIYTDDSTAILKAKNVEPHIDCDVGIKPLKGYRFWGGVFGLLAGAGSITLQVGNNSIRLAHGDWVMFNDRRLHGVYSEKTWYGLAVQIAKKR